MPDTFPVHPAADLFPLMDDADLRELAADIAKHGLRNRITFFADGPGKDTLLLDGRNRLAAMELAGIPTDKLPRTTLYASEGADPFAFVLSANLHRRHLTPEQKRDLIAKLLKADPTKSDRQIAKQTKADHKTVAVVRSEKEGRGEIPHVEKRTDSNGRKQPARKCAKPTPIKPAISAQKVVDLPTTESANVTDDPAISAEKRKQEYSESEHKAVSAKDTARQEFDEHVLRLMQMTRNARPGRFALSTGVPRKSLKQLGEFLVEVASELPNAEAAE